MSGGSGRTAVFVGAVVVKRDAVLLVRQSPGHPLAGQWTVPWGRVEDGESPAAAALRETWEEGGVRAEVEGLLGVQELPSPQQGGIALVYLCSHAGGEPAPRDRETDAAGYYTRAQLDALREPLEPWSAWLVRRVLSGRFTLTRPQPGNPLGGKFSFL
ncbi:MAG TPA: NUDIX domain-containing protein [Gammaproteobacteria bacterium]